MTDDMVVILTAFNLEYDAVRRRLIDPQVHLHDKGTLFEIGKLKGGNGRVALGLTGKGNNASAVLAERSMARFSPAAVVFVGVAGALWDTTPLGDVVVATHVYGYHGGTSQDDGFKARPRVWEAPHGISQLASHIERLGDWADDMPPGVPAPKAHFGAIAAGEVVHNSRISSEARLLREHYSDALAIEMEGAGVAQAGHLSGMPVAIVRGISDRADGTKKTSEDGIWQPRAAANAAAFAIRLAQHLVDGRERTTMSENTNARHGDTVNNYASGPVGIQAGTVTGSTVWIGAASQVRTAGDLASELAAFRDQLERERTNGRVDDDTFEAAKAELDVAGKAVANKSLEGKSAFVLAMKRLRGLVGDVADLAAKAAAMIAAANVLS